MLQAHYIRPVRRSRYGKMNFPRVALTLLIATVGSVTQFVALPASGQTPSSAARLQPLVNDAVAQLKISYRHDRVEREKRYEEIGRAAAAWNKSKRDAADNERLAEWLRGAMRVSMPGSHEPLPPLPEFAPAKTKDERNTEKKSDVNESPTTSVETTAEPQTGRRAMEVHAPAAAATSSTEQLAHENADATSPMHTAETFRPAAADESDPFRDDPLPDEN
jgi:hypothetical protein